MADDEVVAHPELPQDGEFYRRVLDYLPTPTIVLDDQARVTYLNLAAQEVFGLSVEAAVGLLAFEFVHPDDIGWATEVFTNVVELGPSPLERSKAGGIHFRVVTAAGEAVPVHITGALGFGDPHVAGIVYDVRPDWGPALMSRILAGLAHGEPVDELLRRVTELVAVPPVPVHVALLDRVEGGGYRVATATEEAFGALAPVVAELGRGRSDDGAVAVRTGELDDDGARRLVAEGYDVAWRAPVDLAGSSAALELVAACRDGLRYEMTVLELMRSAADLASVVLLRAENDAQVLHAATHDSLTGLPNRRALEEHVEAHLAEGRPMALLYVDLDGFKPVNDRHGHAAGDAVLQAIAERLLGCAGPDALVARIGGDEFAVCVPGALDDRAAEALAVRVADVIAAPIDGGRLPGVSEVVSVSASVGHARSGQGTSADALLAAADEAMYEAKRGVDRRRP